MTALARKYRPQTISHVIGQDPLVRILTNALDTNKIGQAFVLTGGRGTGKTSTARIIAKSINCEHGPTSKPCENCASCKEIASETSLNVLEMDAASQNGAEDMRNLLKTVSYAPMGSGKYKIYIIDEAHMLSNAAWNTLLKTLEEPPKHVIFIFATTEERKIPATVLSRCQKFSLRQIDVPLIADRLRFIADQENAQLEKGVSEAIARAGEGSMRDAISILDQAISGAGGAIISLTSVLDMLGKARRADIINLLHSLIAGDIKASIHNWRQIVEAGVAPLSALDDMMVLLHLCALASLDTSSLEASDLIPDDRTNLAQLASNTSLGHLVGAQKMLISARSFVSSNPNHSQAAEILIMRLVVGFGSGK